MTSGLAGFIPAALLAILVLVPWVLFQRRQMQRAERLRARAAEESVKYLEASNRQNVALERIAAGLEALVAEKKSPQI
jgi:hypothetical protein